MRAPGTALERAHRQEWARLVAVLVRDTRALDLAEDIAQEAFSRAAASWPRDGAPPNPGAWLTTTARNLLRDDYRRRQALARKLPLLIVDPGPDEPAGTEDLFGDERLRLIFTCCHPALSLEARVALSLRLVCGLATDEIARLFLVQPSTMAARITRARKKIANAGIPYRVPGRDEIEGRLQGVLAVIYLVYTEGHTATHGEDLWRPELLRLATDLVKVLSELMPGHPEVQGLRALIMLTEARQGTRFDDEGNALLLEDMDRSQWDQAAINQGVALVEQVMRATPRDRPGPYALQAAIAALHAEAPSFEATDWPQILALYTLLVRVNPSPVVALGRVVSLGMVEGPQAGLDALDGLAQDAGVAGFPMLPAVRADLLRRAGRYGEAAEAYRQAATLAGNRALARDLTQRGEEMDGAPG